MSKSKNREWLEKTAIVDRKEIYQGKFFQLVQDKVQDKNHLTKTFDLILHPGAVAIIPIDSKGRLILVEQWRPAAGRIMIELPAGTLEKGELPIDCANRELREETGYRGKDIIPIGGFYSAPGILSEYVHIFFAQDLVHDPLTAEDTDEIDLLPLSLSEALEKIQTGEIVDAKTVAGVLWYNQWLAQ